MDFQLPLYNIPDFSAQSLVSSPDAATRQVEMDGVAPDNYHATTIFPEYFKISGKWYLVEKSRMDLPVRNEK